MSTPWSRMHSVNSSIASSGSCGGVDRRRPTCRSTACVGAEAGDLVAAVVATAAAARRPTRTRRRAARRRRRGRCDVSCSSTAHACRPGAERSMRPPERTLRAPSRRRRLPGRIVRVRLLVIEDEVRLADAVARGLRTEGFEVDVAHTGPDGLWRAREGTLRGDRARHPAARAERLRRVPRAARRRRPHAGPDAHGEAGRARRGRGARARRRRLPAQAVQLRRPRRPAAGADPPGDERRRRRAGDRRPARRSGEAPVLARAERARAHGPRAGAARRPRPARRWHGDEARAARRGVGLRLRRRRQHRRGVRRATCGRRSTGPSPATACRRCARSATASSTTCSRRRRERRAMVPARSGARCGCGSPCSPPGCSP